MRKRVGHAGFLAFYFACGIGASLDRVILDPKCMFPIIGTCGAVAGLAGSALLLFPLERIGITFAERSVRIPAILWIGLLLLGGALTNAVLSFITPEIKLVSIGYIFHACGFVAEIVLTVMLGPRSIFTGAGQ